MNSPHQITGDVPDFIVARKLTALAHELFTSDAYTQPIGLDEELHELIQTMQEVGLVEMAMALKDGVQIVLYRLAE